MREKVIRNIKKGAHLGVMTYRHLLYQLIGLRNETVTLQTKQGIFTIPTRSNGISAHFYRDRQYELDSSLRTIEFLRTNQFVPSQNIQLIDIGANIGVIGIGLLIAGKVNRVVAIEPEPRNFQLLQHNVQQNHLTGQLLPLQFAVGDQKSTITMELSPTNAGDHRIRVRPSKNATEHDGESSRKLIQVELLPLPELLDSPEVKSMGITSPSVIWADVQGFEGFVFKGAASLIKGLPTVTEIWPYGILRAGMELEEFSQIIESLWSDFWIERQYEPDPSPRFVRYPTTVFLNYLHDLGSHGHFENVILTSSPINK